MKYIITSVFLSVFSTLHASSMKVQALRLTPGQDVMLELDKFIRINKIEAASIISAVGSLKEANLRFANKDKGTKLTGPLEILSLSGTAGIAGAHYHMAVSDSEGKTTGGHLLEGNLVYTTLELVIGTYPELSFKRTADKTYGYEELNVQKK